MDPVSVGLLVAVAGGAGGELGRQAWSGLSALVQRPFRCGADTGQVPVVSSGAPELVALQQAPADEGRAQALSTALAVRAAIDGEFRGGLERWHEQAMLTQAEEGDTRNTVSGGTQYGPVLQGRDFSGFTFTTSPPPVASAVSEDGDTPPRQE
ncbi:hypothetical protein [Streptomyces camelliae]|uniref:Uncharacterized protein n=1 Tax=Streptomyces camelliae TaxID=3004093 RepID=A0ABY7PJX1_9ACTN|nr:hypothetical protein [Streptomyces sp. HUAS 2-6]WBO69506.1 hypothetical protein O1G22_42905 [Streptomyces sp. HUAS 2-6]